MKRLIFKVSFLLIVILSLTLSLEVKAGNAVETQAKPKQEVVAKKLDSKAEILAGYLAKQNSPLQYHAQDFIDAANQYDLDWRLVAAISGVESTFGKFIPGGYNGWGWGVYGTQAIYFSSWREAIFTVSEGLREKYINKGYTEPYSMNRIYAASPFWGGKVTFFMSDIEKFAQNYEGDNISYITTSNVKIAAASGLLTLR